MPVDHTLIVLCFSFTVLVVFALLVSQWLSARERDVLTKKLMAKNLSEYQQEEITKIVTNNNKVKREENPEQIPAHMLSLTEVENDPELSRNVHSLFNQQ